MSPIDRLIGEFDRALRTSVSGMTVPNRQSPAEQHPQRELEDRERSHAAALMRVNHVGEICAQALYQGQRVTARDRVTRSTLEQAAREEEDHLAWCAMRIDELGGRQSVLNPLWYAGSFAIGGAAGLLGDKWSLAFLAETENQVEQHLARHLGELPVEDLRTHAVVEAMQADEAGHRDSAIRLGA